jgi:hypothetical protein
MSHEDGISDLMRQEADRYVPSKGLAAIRRRIRTRRRRRRTLWAGLSLVGAALIAVAAVVATGGGTPGSQRVNVQGGTPALTHVAPLASPGLSPHGWDPVQFGAIEVSVPSSWLVEDSGDIGCGGDGAGEVFLPRLFKLPARMDCRTVANTVVLEASSDRPLRHSRRATINGITVTTGVSGSGADRSVVERGLGVQVVARGPLGTRVLRTLTHSPLSVVLGSTVTSVPSGWHQVSYGGLRVQVPASWKLIHEPASCPSNLQPDYLVLQTANDMGSPSCMTIGSTAGTDAARPGLVMTSGRLVTNAPKGSVCHQRSAVRICVDPSLYSTEGHESGYDLGILTAQISLPGQAHPDQIELGLNGTGLQALQIFDSIEPASSH